MYTSKFNLGNIHVSSNEGLSFPYRRIPIKVILSENEEVSSSDNITETADDLSNYTSPQTKSKVFLTFRFKEGGILIQHFEEQKKGEKISS